jgi:hypothetical protein
MPWTADGHHAGHTLLRLLHHRADEKISHIAQALKASKGVAAQRAMGCDRIASWLSTPSWRFLTFMERNGCAVITGRL